MSPGEPRSRWPLAILTALLLICAWLALAVELRYPGYARGVPVSLLGYLLPPWLLASPALLAACKLGFLGAALLWVLRRALPWSAWAAALSFIALGSLYWENLPWFRHKYVVPALLLIGHALWSHAHLRRASARARAPAWAPTLYLLLIAQFYAQAGLAKLTLVGPSWGDGLSLQLWLEWLGDRERFLTRLLLSDRLYARAAQTLALALELLAPLMLLGRRARLLVGSALLGMHLAIHVTLRIDFLSQMAILAVFTYAPWERFTSPARRRTAPPVAPGPAAAAAATRRTCPLEHGL
ncbi:MAG: hypothetical protein H6713_04160 [Myxococcales bacterium]|nr:hypothetical protein [Myxococcales bacterium]